MTSTRITRRAALTGATLFAAWSLGGAAVRAEMVEDASQLKPGQYTWHPERSPDGPVAIIVSIPDQLVFVYRNGIRIAVSTCSTGKPGHATPTGVFTILQKDKDHHSDEYDNAPMPNMNRLTWSGVALHAGNLPGYPASHGCVRLPLEFSALLFTVTHVGTAVIIADTHADPVDVDQPGLVLSKDAEHDIDTAEAKLKGAKAPDPNDANAITVSILVSSADNVITVMQNGDTVISGPATITPPDKPLGQHVFILSNVGGGGMHWHDIAHGLAGPVDNNVIDRIRAEPDVVKAMTDRLHIGMILVTTDLPATTESRTGKDFVVMQQEPDPVQ